MLIFKSRPLGIALVLMLVVFLSFTTGCSKGEEAGEKEKDTAQIVNLPEEKSEEATKEELPEQQLIDNWLLLQNLDTMVDLFETIKYSWASSDGAATNFTFQFLGSEHIAEVEAAKVSLTIEEQASLQEIIVWLDDEGRTVQVQVDNEILPSQFAGAAEAMVGMIFFPFTMARDLQVDQVVQDRIPGWSVESIKADKRNFGQLAVDVHTVIVKVGPPMTGNDSEATIQWQIADFGDFQMMVGWDSKMSDELGNQTITFQVNQIVLR